MLKFKTVSILIAALFFIALASCSKGGGINIFSIEDDKQLGAQIAAEIAADPATYPLLKESEYPEAYALLYDIRDRILDAGQVEYKDEFAWQLKIVHDDNVLNAFCTPGGYIYVYTGLIKYLENEAQLAGVLGHEIAHADLRHVTDQLTEQYGISLLLSLLLGQNQNVLTDIAVGLVGLSFSRGDESQADEYSVIYLCPSEYYAAGAAGFFELIEASGGSDIPEFLSTHPSPENRIEDIYTVYNEMACPGDETFDARYVQLKNALP
ncbi:MAG: M48 family metalloprotease [Chitinophagales bacterium]